MSDPLSLAWLAGPLLAGLAGSPHCVGMCGGFVVAASEGPRGALGAGAWTLGRLITYGLLGAVAGAFGQHLPGPTWVGTAVAGALLVYFAARLAGFGGLSTATPSWLPKAAGKVARRADLPSRVLFGMLSGLLPCGLVYTALAFPVASGSPAVGALSMVAFGLGTVPALAAAGVGLRRIVTRSLTARRVLAAAVLLFGMGSLFMRSRASMAAASHSPDPQTTEAPSCH